MNKTVKGEIMNRYGRYARFKTQNGKADEVAELLLQDAEAMATMGTQVYIVSKDSMMQNYVHVFAVWNSIEDREASLSSPDVGKTVASMMPLLNGRPESFNLDIVGGIDLKQAHETD